MSKVEKEEVVVVLEKKKNVVTNSMTWTKEQAPQRARQRPQNIIKNPAGIKPEYREKVEPLDAWSVFVNDDLIQMIVTCTNQSIKQSLSKCKQSASDKNVAHLYETNEREMKAFIGLWYIRGLLNWNNNDITFTYSQIYGNKIFSATMSIKRFCFLCVNLRFDDISSRNTRFQHNCATAIRDLFESFVRNCEKVMHPDVYLSLDEMLYPTRVGVAFRRYNKDKPGSMDCYSEVSTVPKFRTP